MSSLSSNNRSSYIAVHDDSRLISINESSFRLTPIRSDGREPEQHRPVQLQLTRTADVATATVRFGSTRITANVTAQLVAPTEDRPNEGWTAISVEMSPMASTSYRAAAPLSTGGGGGSSNPLPSMDRYQRLKTNPILRAIERCWEAALDTEALCITPGQFVWKLSAAITIVQDDGNCLDAAVLASVAALRHYRQPIVDANATPPVLQPHKEPIPLPLHVTPLAMTFGVLLNKKNNGDEELQFWVDPTGREELCCETFLSLALTIHGQLCWWTYAGHEVHMAQLRSCHDTAAALLPELNRHVQQALEKADQQALQTRLEQQQQVQPPPNVPFLTEAPQAPVDIVAPTQKEEEEYRKQALDYNKGHVTAKVREDASMPKKKQQDNRQLLSALLQSVAAVSMEDNNEQEKDDTTTATTPMQVDAVDETTKEGAQDDLLAAQKQVEPKAQQQKMQSSAVLDSDEEETTTQLQTEFQTKAMEQDLDLSAAIKKGKKKKKKR